MGFIMTFLLSYMYIDYALIMLTDPLAFLCLSSTSHWSSTFSRIIPLLSNSSWGVQAEAGGSPWEEERQLWHRNCDEGQTPGGPAATQQGGRLSRKSREWSSRCWYRPKCKGKSATEEMGEGKLHFSEWQESRRCVKPLGCSGSCLVFPWWWPFWLCGIDLHSSDGHFFRYLLPLVFLLRSINSSVHLLIGLFIPLEFSDFSSVCISCILCLQRCRGTAGRRTFCRSPLPSRTLTFAGQGFAVPCSCIVVHAYSLSC